MTERIRVGIAGTGAYLPERAVKNEFFEGIVDTSDEWITKRTGIKERRFAADHEATSDLALEASKRALDAAVLEDLGRLFRFSVPGPLRRVFPLGLISQDQSAISRFTLKLVHGESSSFYGALPVWVRRPSPLRPRSLRDRRRGRAKR